MKGPCETDKWDGHAAIAALREDHAPMSAEEAAGGPPAKCEANSALATCLDKLARQVHVAFTHNKKLLPPRFTRLVFEASHHHCL